MSLFGLACNPKLKITLRNCQQSLYVCVCALTRAVSLVSRKARTEDAKKV